VRRIRGGSDADFRDQFQPAWPDHGPDRAKRFRHRHRQMPVAPARLAPDRQLGQVTAQLIAKNMNIAPTLEIRPGYRFNVIVTKDMTFSKPYQSFDY
jgi:type IV secretory pathway VirB10-like protein